jgi:hypothetical protein
MGTLSRQDDDNNKKHFFLCAQLNEFGVVETVMNAGSSPVKNYGGGIITCTNTTTDHSVLLVG